VPPQPLAVAPSKTRVVCDLVLREGLLNREQVDAVIARLGWSGERIEEALLELGMATEAELLKVLAGHYKTFFVSSEKLAKAEVARSLLDMLPQRFAEKVGICPVVFDAKTHALSVVTADPDDVETLREVQIASGAREVKAVLARPAAVKALLAKTYGADVRAFDVFERYAPGQLQVVYEKTAIDAGSSSAGRASSSRERVFDAGDITRTAAVKPPPPPPPPKSQPRAPAALPAPDDSAVAGASFTELLHVMVSLLETSRADLRGHSSLVARLVRRMGEKLKLDPGATTALVVAAFAHDLGKMGQFHLTALNCSEYDGHKAAAQKACGVPTRLLEPVRIPNDAVLAVAHMYERFDGKGFPDGMVGKDIPLGARVLAICDTYADLTANPRNPFRKALSPEDGCAALVRYKDTVFDANLIDVFRSTVLGEELTARLLATRAEALIVDIDPEETTVLELRMSEQGFVVRTARTAEQALKVLAEGRTDLVISEIELGASDGLALLVEARSEPWGKDVPWVIYTRRQERAIAQKAFDLGVLDYVTKPASTDVLVAKLRALLEQRATKSGGVSGSLREMGLPDMVQVLFHARKSGNLKIRARDGSGEVHLADGAVVDAIWRDLRGEEAFYAMLKLRDGDFALDPAFRATSRVIHQSSESLLLEGMRRLDEDAR
jgi:response regulator RpfG family c-di-GMP phosphodiesterase